ncbi:MAG: DUF1688 family protein [Rhodobacteraceae bacterium]|nr:DUF1688 family protein [Paracoccaceae bacterium]
MSPVIALLSADEVTKRSRVLYEQVVRGEVSGISVDLEALRKLGERVAAQVSATAEATGLLPWGPWRHFEANEVDRWDALASSRGFQSATDMLQCAGDLAILAAVSQVSFPQSWRYDDPLTETQHTGPQGLSLAVFAMFGSGSFSAEPSDPLRVDGHALVRLTEEEIAAGFQLDITNQRDLVDQLLAHYKRFGETMALRPDCFEVDDATRPGNLLIKLTEERGPTQVAVVDVFERVLDALSPLWHGGVEQDGVVLGDTWNALALHVPGDLGTLFPFHLPAISIANALLEPFAWAGIEMTGLADLPAPSDLQHLALMLDAGVLSVTEKQNDFAELDPLDRAVLLRSTVLQLLSELSGITRTILEVAEEDVPLTCLIQGGTSLVATQLAKEKPEFYKAAANLISVQGVFWLRFEA